MTLYYDKKGRYRSEFREYWIQLPDRGQAATVQGELVRAIGRLASEYYENGNGNWDTGFEIWVDFLEHHLNDSSMFAEDVIDQINHDLTLIRDFEYDTEPDSEGAEDRFDRVIDRVVEWCQQHPEPIAKANNPDLKR